MKNENFGLFIGNTCSHMFGVNKQIRYKIIIILSYKTNITHGKIIYLLNSSYA